MSKKYIIDIDGTICTITEGNYEIAKPYTDRIDFINKLYDAGNIIVYFTARGMGSSKNSKVLAYLKWYFFTKRQLRIWGVRYNKLIFGKPSGDFYIDDKGIRDVKFFKL